MFTYWKGYEIDGSSTTYNIVIPQRELMVEVLQYIINLKIIDRNDNINISYAETGDNLSKNVVRKDNIYKFEEIEKILEITRNPSILDFHINIYCVHPDKLFPQIRKEIYSLSRTRPGAENKAYSYKKPTISPFYYAPNFEVWIDVSFHDHEKTVEDYKPEGLMFNEKALVDNLRNKHLTIKLGCGPGFIYEYAAFIMSKIAERFPEVGIDGGIDCAGGFIDGCTYSCNLYDFERVTLTTENIAQTITYMLEKLEIKPMRRVGKYGWEHEECSTLVLYNLFDVDRWQNEYIGEKAKIIKNISGGKQEYTPEEYEQFVEKISEVELFNSIDFTYYCTCCVKIKEELCALTCIKEEGRIWLEFRVISEIREEFEKELISCGISIR